MPIVNVLLNKFVANGNTLLTAYICKALGRLCDGQREIAEMVLNAGISSYLLFLYWQAVDNERERSSKSDVDDVLFEDIFGLLGLLAYYERPQSLKLLAPLPTFPPSAPFVFPPEDSSKAAVKHNKRKAYDSSTTSERSIAMQGPKRTDAEVYAEQERVMQSYMKRAASTPDLVDIIAVVLDLVLAPTTNQPPASTDWYYVQCAAWQISMILTNGMAVRDSIYRRQRLINALVFHKMLRLIDQYADVMPAACLCALSQALSYSVLGASSAQIGYLVCCGIVHTLLLVISHQKTTRKCLLCVLHAMNAILSMGERDRMPGKRRGGGSGVGGGEWGDEDDEWDDEEDVDEYGDEEEDWEDEEEDMDWDSSEDDDEYMLVAESEKRRKGDGEEGEERRRGVRRRRKRQGNDRRAREKSERRHAKQDERKELDDSTSTRQSRSNRAKTSRDTSPSRSLHHPQYALAMDATSASALSPSIQPSSLPPATSTSAAANLPTHTHSDPTFCKSCHACIHCLDKPPPYPSSLSSSVLPFPLPGNGYVSILRLYSAETIFHRLELSTSKRSSKEDQALLALIRKLLSYFQHTSDARVQNPFLRLDKDSGGEAETATSTAPPPASASAPNPESVTSLAAGNTAAVAEPVKSMQWSPPSEPLKVIPPTEWTVNLHPPDTAADLTTSTTSTASDTASTSSELSTTSTASTSASLSVSVSFCRPHSSVLLRGLHRARQRRLRRLGQQQFQQKRRELRFLLTGIRGELPAVFNTPPQPAQSAKAREKEKSKAREAAREQSAANAAAKAAKAEASKKASIEELIRQMQEKERVLTAMQESKKAELRELKEKEKEIKDKKERDRAAKAARDGKEEGKETESATTVASAQQDEEEAGEDEEDDEDDKSSPAAAEDRARRKKDKRGKKKEKQKAGKKKVAEKAKATKVKVDYKAAVADGSAAEVDDVIERMREERRREQEEMERKRVEAGLQTAAQERLREAEEERDRQVKREEQQRLEKERKEREEQKRKMDEQRRKEEEARKKEEREKQRQKQIEEDKEKERKRQERERQRELEEKKRREEEDARIEQERANERQRAAEAAALAVAYASRPLHTCRYSDCSCEHRILASDYYVVLTCSTHCRIRYHHRSLSSSPSTGNQPSCWDLAFAPPATVTAGSPCQTADCAGVVQSASWLHGEAELVEHIIAPPPAVERTPQPLTESKAQKRERKRAERQKSERVSDEYAVEEKKEAEVEVAAEAEKGKKVYKGGLEVLVPAKEKDFVPVIPRPSLFAAVAADEVKEKMLLPLSPRAIVTSAAGNTAGTVLVAASQGGTERKKGRQARKTRIDIFLPEAEPEEEEQLQSAEDDSVQAQPAHYAVEMTNTAYGGFVRCYTNASTSPLLYCRCLSSSMDDDSVIQWMVSQCAMMAPIYVTRFFAPSAVLVQYPDLQTAVKAYQSLSGAMYMQFAIEPCSIVSGDEVRAVQAYQELMMNKLRAAHAMQHSQPFDSSSYLYDSRQSEIEQPLPPLEAAVSADPDIGAAAAGSVYAGFFERESATAADDNVLVSSVVDVEDDLDTEQFDFSFLTIGADEYDDVPAHSTSPPVSDSPPTPLHVDKRSVSGTFPSFGSSWSAPHTETSAGSSWASPAHGPSPSASFSTLPAVSSVFSPMPASTSTPAAPTPLFTPSSPSLKPASIASLTPALDPVLSSPSFPSPTSPTDTVSSQRRSISSVAPLFPSGSLFSSASATQASAESSSTSSGVFSLPSFSMFSSLTRSISITDDTSNAASASTSTTAPSFFSSSSSSASSSVSSSQLLHVPSSSSAVRQSLSSSVSDDDEDEVWNDEKMSRFVLKSDAEDEEEDAGLTAIPTHPRHDSMDDSSDGPPVVDGREEEHDTSDVRTNSDSINAYDQDIDRDFSQRSELPVEEDEQLQYDSRQPQPRYTAINTSPSPRFTRSVYTPAAVSSAMPSIQSSPLHPGLPYGAHQPTMLHSEAASMSLMYGGGMVHGWNGSVSPSPGYAPYSYNGYGGVPPAAHYYPYAQYGASAMYMQQQQQQLGMLVGRQQQQQHRLLGRGVPAPKLPPAMPVGMPGMNPLAGIYTQQAGLGSAYSQQPQQQQQRPGENEEVSPTDGSFGRDDRRRAKRGFVVDLEADFPSLGAAPSAPTAAATSALSPSSNPSPSSSSTHSTAAYSQSHTAPSGHDVSHAESNGHAAAGAEGGAGWTGTLANKLKGSKDDKRPGTAGSPTSAVNPPPGSPPARQQSTVHTVPSLSASSSSASSPISVSSPQSLSSARQLSAGKPQLSSVASHPQAVTATARYPQQLAGQQQQRAEMSSSARKEHRASVDSKIGSATKQSGSTGSRSSGGSAPGEWTEVVSGGKKKKR